VQNSFESIIAKLQELTGKQVKVVKKIVGFKKQKKYVESEKGSSKASDVMVLRDGKKLLKVNAGCTFTIILIFIIPHWSPYHFDLSYDYCTLSIMQVFHLEGYYF